MNKNSESQKIAEIIDYLENRRKPYEEWNRHAREALSREGAKIDGFIFVKDFVGSWTILKPTNICEEPQFKGEPLTKIVPEQKKKKNGIESMVKILDEEVWMYF